MKLTGKNIAALYTKHSSERKKEKQADIDMMQMSIRVKESTYALFKSVCEIERRTNGQMFRKMLDAFLEKSGLSNEEVPTKNFNHGYGFGFAVISSDPHGDDVTPEMLLKACRERLARLEAIDNGKEILSACALFDTYQMEDTYR